MDFRQLLNTFLVGVTLRKPANKGDVLEFLLLDNCTILQSLLELERFLLAFWINSKLLNLLLLIPDAVLRVLMCTSLMTL